MFVDGEALRWYDPWLLFPNCPLGPGGGDRDEEARQDVPHDLQEGRASSLGTAAAAGSAATSVGDATRRARAETLQRLNSDTLSSERDASRSEAVLLAALRRGEHPSAATTTQRTHSRTAVASVSANRQSGLASTRSSERSALLHDNNNDDGDDHDGDNNSSSSGDDDHDDGLGLRRSATGARDVSAQARELRDFFGGAPARLGAREEPVLCPLDTHADPLVHIAAAAEVFAVVTAGVPQVLYIFDQLNNLPISSVVVSGTTYPAASTEDAAADSRASAAAVAAAVVVRDCAVAPEDRVSLLSMDPTGHYCVLVFDSGKAVCFHIPHRAPCAPPPRRDATAAPEVTVDSVQGDGDGDEERRRRHRRQRLAESKSAARRWLRFDLRRRSADAAAASAHDSDEGGDAVSAAAACRPQGFSLVMDLPAPHAHRNHQQQQPQQQYARVTRPISFVPACVGWCRHMSGGGDDDDDVMDVDVDGQPLRSAATPSSLPITSPSAEVLLGALRGGAIVAARLTPTGVREARVVFTFSAPVANASVDSVVALRTAPAVVYGTGATCPARDAATTTTSAAAAAAATFRPHIHTPHFTSADDGGGGGGGGGSGGGASRRGGAPLRHDGVVVPAAAAPTTAAAAAAVRRWVVLVSLRNRLYVFSSPITASASVAGAAPPPLLTGRVEDAFACCAAGTQRCYVDVEADALSDYSGGECGGGVYSGAPSCIHANGGALVTRPEVRRGTSAGDAARAGESAESRCRLRVVDPSTAGAAPQLLASSPSRGVLHLVLPDAVPERAAGGAGRAPAEGTTLVAPATLPAAFYWQYGDVLVQGIVLYGAGGLEVGAKVRQLVHDSVGDAVDAGDRAADEEAGLSALLEEAVAETQTLGRRWPGDDDDDGARGSARDAGAAGTAGGAGVATRQRSPSVVPALPSTMLLPISILSVVNVNACLRSVRGLLAASDAAHTTAHGRSGPVLAYTRAAVPLTASSANAGRHADAADGPAACRHPYLQFPWSEHLELSRDAVRRARRHPPRPRIAAEAEADDDGKAAAVSATSAPATMSVALLDGALARGDFDVETLRRLRAMAAAYVRRSPLLFDASPEALLRATAAEQHVTSPPPSRARSPAARDGGRRARPPRRAVCSGVATGQHDGEVLVSLAASYSHLALSTTEGVFVVAHAAALPLEEAATAWRRALVYHAVVAATASSSSSSVSPAFTVVADAAAPDMFYAASTRRIARLQTAAPATSSAGQRQLVLQLLNAAARLERCGGAPASPCVATTTASTASPAAEAVVVVPSSLAHEVRLRGCLRQSEPATSAWGQQSCGWDGVAAASVSSSHTVAPHSRSRSGTGEPLSALRRGTNGEVDEDNDNGAAPAASATLVPPLRHRHTPPPPSGAASSLSHRSSSSGANDGAVAQHGRGHDADPAPLSRRMSSASLDAAALPHRHAGSPIVSVMMDAAPSSPAPGRHSASASLSAALRTSSAAVTFTRARSVSFAPQAALDDDDDDEDDGGVREREAGAELASTSVPVLDTHRGVADAFRTALDAAGAASCAEDRDLLGFLRANPLLHVMMHEAARTGYHDASVAPCARSVRSGRHVRAVNVPGFGLLPGSVGLTPLPRGISPAQACMLLERPFGALLYTADHLYEMTLAACVSGTSSRRRGLSGQEIELLGIVRRAYGRYLLASRRYLEAAVQLGRAPERVRDHRDHHHHQHHDGGGAASLLTTVVELVQVFRASNSLEPLWLLLRLRLRQLESSREGVGGHALTVSVLATWLLALDLEGCSAARAGAQAERAPAPPPSYTRVEWIRRRYGLDDPRALLGDTLRRYGRFIDLSVLSTLLGRLAAAPEAVLVAELLGSPEASVATLALRQRNYLAGLVRLEALLVDPAARAPETQTLLQALVQEEPGLAGAATHAPPLRVVVGGRLSAAVEAAAGAGGEACVAAPLLSVLPVAPRNFAHPTHALTDLITRLAPLLLRCYPRRFVDGCLLTVVRERPDLVLHPRRLLPALLAYSVGSNESDAEASGSAVAVLRAVATARHTGSTCADTGAHDDRRCPPSSRSPTPSSSAEEISFDEDIQLSEPHVEDTALVAAAPPPSLSPEAPFTLTAEPTVPSPARRTGATESTSAPSRPSADVCCSDDDDEDVSVASGRGSAASSSDSAEAMLCEDGQPRRCGSSRSLTRRHRAAAMAAAAAAAARAAMVPSLTPDAVDDRPSTAPPNAVLAYLREVADPADAAGDADPVDAALLVAYATALERDGGDGALAAFAERVALRFVHAAAAAADAGGATAAGSRSGCSRSSVAPAAAYGLQHLFRLCARHRRWVGCVWMYLALGHHRDAVQLALTGVTGDAGVQLAVRLLQLLHERDAQHERAVRVGERPWRGCASLTSVTDVVARGAEGSDTQQQQQQQRAAVRRSRRELWMLVVQHLIHGGGGDGGGGVGGGGARDGAQAALRLSLHAGIDGVDVTDVLPALPDTIVLAELQEQLLASLRGLSHRIRALRADATALGRDSRVLHHELNDVAQTPLLLPADARCVLCGQPALAHPFIVYPRCRHVMHASCYHSARRATRPPHAEAPPAAPSWSVGGSTAAPTCVAECLLCARQHLHRILDAPLSTVLAGDDARQPRPRVSLR
ncbi:Vacuolar sorting protein 39 domain 2 [Novymonas esmeraldas]|uniref:Vacuolar sorting protein 39 domain 2 n=1 Tax=Novymonas esmeraldas TaxID=1808958 RepID=A0AAW0F7S7_9TRYP